MDRGDRRGADSFNHDGLSNRIGIAFAVLGGDRDLIRARVSETASVKPRNVPSGEIEKTCSIVDNHG